MINFLKYRIIKEIIKGIFRGVKVRVYFICYCIVRFGERGVLII